jgi:putative addiction module CopG family antidote
MKITTMNISLPGELARFVRQKVESGRYASVSEVVREALRRLSGDEQPGGVVRTLGGTAFDRTQAQAAVRGIVEVQQAHSLGSLSIEEIISEGRQT